MKDLQDHELQVEEDVWKERLEVVQRQNQRAMQNPEKPNRWEYFITVQVLEIFQWENQYFFSQGNIYFLSNDVQEILKREW